MIKPSYHFSLPSRCPPLRILHVLTTYEREASRHPYESELREDYLLLLSPDMAKLSFQKLVHKTNHRWRSPLVEKEDLTRPVIEGWVGGPFFILSNLVLVPPASSSSSTRRPDAPTPRRPKTRTFASGARCQPYELWLKSLVHLVNKLSCTPKRAKSVSCFHFV